MHTRPRRPARSALGVSTVALVIAGLALLRGCVVLPGNELGILPITVGGFSEWGASLVSPEGGTPPLLLRGIPGPVGPEGRVGAPGPQGVPGDPETPGPAGAEGRAGDPGREGDPGADGLPGATGVAGADGVAGAAGEKGDPGPRGAPGEPGPVGPAGPPGAQGEPGPPGSADGVALGDSCLFTHGDGQEVHGVVVWKAEGNAAVLRCDTRAQ